MTFQAFALRWADTSFPGWLEVEFEDAVGHLHRVIEKVPVLTSGQAPVDATFPFELRLRGSSDEASEDAITVTLAYGMSTSDGLKTLRLPSHSVEPLEG